MDLDKTKDKINIFLETKIAPLEKKKKIAICLLTWIVPLLLFGYFFIYPKQKEITSLGKQRAVIIAEVNEAKGKASELDAQKAEQERTMLMLEKASVLLPQNKEIPALLSNISSLGTKAGLDFLTFQPMAEVPLEFYAQIPVSISVRGPYHSVGSFLYAVSNLDRIVSVSNIKMSSPTIQGGQMVLNSNFSLITYKFLDEKDIVVEKDVVVEGKK